MRRADNRGAREGRWWTAEQKAKLIEGWCESGLSQAEFCRREKLCYSRFLAWVEAVRARKEDAPEFVEVLGGNEGGAEWRVEPGLEITAPNGWRVRVESGCDADTLQRVLEVVGRC